MSFLKKENRKQIYDEICTIPIVLASSKLNKLKINLNKNLKAQEYIENNVKFSALEVIDEFLLNLGCRTFSNLIFSYKLLKYMITIEYCNINDILIVIESIKDHENAEVKLSSNSKMGICTSSYCEEVRNSPEIVKFAQSVYTLYTSFEKNNNKEIPLTLNNRILDKLKLNYEDRVCLQKNLLEMIIVVKGILNDFEYNNELNTIESILKTYVEKGGDFFYVYYNYIDNFSYFIIVFLKKSIKK